MIREAAGALTAAAAVSAWAVRGRSSSVFAPSVWKGPASARALALTFDDGPSESTPELLDILARHHARATFFQCGINAERLPAVARAVAEAGHEIGNHTHTHPRLDFMSAAAIAREVSQAQSAISNAAGIEPRLFRAPYGVRWFGLGAAQRQFDLLGVMWTTIALDWRLPADAICARLLKGATNGAILCLHDGRATQPRPDVRAALQAVQSAIPLLVDQGFRLVTVSELLCLNPPRPAPQPNP